MSGRPDIPSLAAWLGDGARADGFEDFVAAAIATADDDALSDDQRALARVICTLCIAAVESGRIETDRHDREWAETTLAIASACGAVAVFAAVAGARPGVSAILREVMLDGFDRTVASVDQP